VAGEFLEFPMIFSRKTFVRVVGAFVFVSVVFLGGFFVSAFAEGGVIDRAPTFATAHGEVK